MLIVQATALPFEPKFAFQSRRGVLRDGGYRGEPARFRQRPADGPGCHQFCWGLGRFMLLVLLGAQGGSGVVISGVISRVTIFVTHMKGLITPRITTRCCQSCSEPPQHKGLDSQFRPTGTLIKGRYGGFRKLGVPYFRALIMKDPTTSGTISHFRKLPYHQGLLGLREVYMILRSWRLLSLEGL